MLSKCKVLVTGSAGFIGSNLVKKILIESEDITLIGVDNLNNYYDVSLKQYRLNEINKLKHNNKYLFLQGDISDKEFIDHIFDEYNFDIVVNLAAQAGVRYSIKNPDVYIKSNIIGFYNILEACRYHDVRHLVYASSSSVYGGNKKVPFSIEDKVDKPVSLYAATKKSNELLAYSYSKLYGIPTTGLRFFTVYGPAGRPDMAYFSFTNRLINNESIDVFNFGKCKRDFTYVDDIVEGVSRVMEKAPVETEESGAPYSLYNIGNSHPEDLLEFIKILSEELKDAKVLSESFNIDEHINLVPMQKGDVEVTYADVSKLENDFGFRPKTSLREGLRKFARWYYDFYVKNRDK